MKTLIGNYLCANLSFIHYSEFFPLLDREVALDGLAVTMAIQIIFLTFVAYNWIA